MKRAFIFSIAVVMGFALILSANTSFACGADKSGVKMGSAGTPKATMAGMVDKSKDTMGKDVAEKAHKAALVTFNVKGMTCAGCENQVKTALKNHKGVTEVVKVSHESDKAVVKYDPTKVEAAKLASVVTKIGFEAEVMPAAAESVKESVKNKVEEEPKEM
jgi:copper chaperone CopZ